MQIKKIKIKLPSYKKSTLFSRQLFATLIIYKMLIWNRYILFKTRFTYIKNSRLKMLNDSKKIL